jgi:hypothetical protein
MYWLVCTLQKPPDVPTLLLLLPPLLLLLLQVSDICLGH